MFKKKQKQPTYYEVLIKDAQNMYDLEADSEGFKHIREITAGMLIPAQEHVESLLNYQYGSVWFYNPWMDEYQHMRTKETLGKIIKVK